MTRPHLARPARPKAARMTPSRPAVERPYRIQVRGLAARAVIGVTSRERRRRQDVAIDLDLEVASRAGQTDRIRDALDYKRLRDEVLDLVEASRFHLVEALAEAIADLVLRQPGVTSATVTVDKLGALRFARSVAVQIHRENSAVMRSRGTGRRQTPPGRFRTGPAGRTP